MTSPQHPPPAPPPMPCPSCSAPRVGNRRGRCRTCNAFAQRVARAVARALQDRHPHDAEAARLDAERAAYARLMERSR